MKHQTTDVPVVHLELGSKLQIAAIKEGDDVYMECSIRAHPWVTKVTWKHNVSNREALGHSYYTFNAKKIWPVNNNSKWNIWHGREIETTATEHTATQGMNSQ